MEVYCNDGHVYWLPREFPDPTSTQEAEAIHVLAHRHLTYRFDLTIYTGLSFELPLLWLHERDLPSSREIALQAWGTDDHNGDRTQLMILGLYELAVVLDLRVLADTAMRRMITAVSMNVAGLATMEKAYTSTNTNRIPLMKNMLVQRLVDEYQEEAISADRIASLFRWERLFYDFMAHYQLRPWFSDMERLNTLVEHDRYMLLPQYRASEA